MLCDTAAWKNPGMSDTSQQQQALDSFLRIEKSDDLLGAAEHARATVTLAVASGTSAASTASWWSSICTAALTAALRCLASDSDRWYVSGSVGRGEALPGADLETLVVNTATDPDQLKAAQERAASVHELLARCGFHEDGNGAFAARARFNRSTGAWADGIGQWAKDPASDRGVVMAGMLADARPLADGPDLRHLIGAAVRAQPQALAAMLQDATHLRAHVPSRLRVFGSGGPVDIKQAAVDPVVRIARWAALSCGSEAQTTPERLTAAAGTRFLDADDARLLARCYAIACSIRWRMRAATWTTSGPNVTTHTVDPVDSLDIATLTPSDRTALRSIAREISGVARKLDYLGSTSAFSTW